MISYEHISNVHFLIYLSSADYRQSIIRNLKKKLIFKKEIMNHFSNKIWVTIGHLHSQKKTPQSYQLKKYN